MKSKYTYLLMSLLTLAFGACSDEHDPVFDPAQTDASQLADIQPTYTLSPASDDFTNFSFTTTKFPIQTAVSYSLEAALGQDFANAVELAVSDGLDIPVTATKMNSTLMAWNVIAENRPVTVYFRIKSFVPNLSGKPTDMFVYSNAISSSIQGYAGEREYPKVWLVGDYCGWNHANSQFLFSYNSDANYQAVVDFADKAANGFKITGAANWDNGNWGIDGAGDAPAAEAGSITLINDGGSGNIACYSKRFYRLAFNTSTLILTKDLSFSTLSIVGDAGLQVSGWGTAEVDMNFDTKKQRFWADVIFGEGEFKFRLDHDWATSFGSKTEGKLDSGDNIKATAGTFRVYVNLNDAGNPTYELNPVDYGK